MEQESPWRFQTDTLYDLALHNEFSDGFRHASKFRTVLGIFVLLVLPVYAFWAQDRESLIFYLILNVVVFAIFAPQLYSRKKGDLQYKRALHANNGQPPYQILTFFENEVEICNRDTQNKNRYGYDQIRSIIETKNLLILTMEYRLCLIVEKRWLKGGTVDELKSWLLSRCPNCKKKVHGCKFGRAVNIILLIALFISAVAALGKLTALNTSAGKLPNSLSAYEIAAQLEPLGITCEEEKLAAVESYWEEYGEYYTDYSKVLDILCWAGAGDYDYDTWKWIPGSNGVYWFDAEYLNVDSMYTEFLSGVSALDPEELAFTHIQEDYSQVDWERGTGQVNISFDWNGNTYGTNASMMNDWFDVSVLETVSDIIGANSDRKLYYAYDGGQGYLVFYSDAQWAKEFTQLTGIALETN